MELLNFFGGAVIGGFIGYIIQHLLQLRSARKLEEMNKKRALYGEMIESLNNVFISDRVTTEDMKNKLLNSYASQWLWASDDVVLATSKHLEMQVKYLSNKEQVSQEELKKTFVEAIIEMRRDLVFKDTCVEPSDYQFVSFY